MPWPIQLDPQHGGHAFIIALWRSVQSYLFSHFYSYSEKVAVWSWYETKAQVIKIQLLHLRCFCRYFYHLQIIYEVKFQYQKRKCTICDFQQHIWTDWLACNKSHWIGETGVSGEGELLTKGSSVPLRRLRFIFYTAVNTQYTLYYMVHYFTGQSLVFCQVSGTTKGMFTACNSQQGELYCVNCLDKAKSLARLVLICKWVHVEAACSAVCKGHTGSFVSWWKEKRCH